MTNPLFFSNNYKIPIPHNLHEAMNTDNNWLCVDPAFFAADVVALMTEKYGIPEDHAIVEFTKSNIFHIITEDQSVAQLPAEELLRLYEKEVKEA